MTATPKELLAAASHLLDWNEGDCLDLGEADCFNKSDINNLARYVLANVRDDDDYLITLEWWHSVCDMEDNRIRIVFSGDDIQSIWLNDGDVSEYIPHGLIPRTRGKIRSLCSVLGITLPEKGS